MSDDRLFAPGDELRFGWQKTLAHLKPWIVLFAISAFLSFLQNSLTRTSSGVTTSPLLALCVQALQVAVTLASLRIALRLADDHPVGDLDLKKLLAGYLPFLLTQLLFGLIVAAGLILLIVPGVIWAVTYGFAPFLCVAEGYDPIESLRESRRLTTGHRRSLFVFGLLLVGINLLGACALGIGLAVTVPTTMIAAAHVLRRLQARAPRSLVPTAPPVTPGPQVPAH
jgi:uncharacterized membrane protein